MLTKGATGNAWIRTQHCNYWCLATSIYKTDKIFTVLAKFHTIFLHLWWTNLENKNTFRKKRRSSCLRVKVFSAYIHVRSCARQRCSASSILHFVHIPNRVGNYVDAIGMNDYAIHVLMLWGFDLEMWLHMYKFIRREQAPSLVLSSHWHVKYGNSTLIFSRICYDMWPMKI